MMDFDRCQTIAHLDVDISESSSLIQKDKQANSGDQSSFSLPMHFHSPCPLDLLDAAVMEAYEDGVFLTLNHTVMALSHDSDAAVARLPPAATAVAQQPAAPLLGNSCQWSIVVI